MRRSARICLNLRWAAIGMVMIVSDDELAQYRSELANYPDGLAALEAIADCEGDLEDAAISIGIQVGQEPTTSDRWLEGLAKRWRHAICTEPLRDNFEAQALTNAVLGLTEHTTLPLRLAVPVALYVIKSGTPTFCEPFESQIR